MSRLCLVAASVLSAATLALPAVADAAPVAWGGAGANDLGPASILLSGENGRVTVRNVQVVMSCTDLTDGMVTDQAWYASSDRPATMRLNRYSMRLAGDAGGFDGAARLTGTLRSNGTGTSRIDLDAQSRDEHGAVIQRCTARVELRLRRGPVA